MTRLMDMVSTYMSMVLNTKDIGKMISKMAKEWKAGKTAADTKEDIKKA